MFGLGMTELLVILAIVVLLFGAGRLPQLGEGVGKMIGNFRRSMKDASTPEVTHEDSNTRKKTS